MFRRERPHVDGFYRRFGKITQKITLRFKAKGFLQYQVRNMAGALIQLSKGEITEEQIKKLLDEPDGDHPSIPRSCAPGNGLTLIDCLYKEGILFKEPQDIDEFYFMRGYKKRLEKMGITYEVPDPDKEHDVGDLFTMPLVIDLTSLPSISSKN